MSHYQCVLATESVKTWHNGASLNLQFISLIAISTTIAYLKSINFKMNYFLMFNSETWISPTMKIFVTTIFQVFVFFPYILAIQMYLSALLLLCWAVTLKVVAIRGWHCAKHTFGYLIIVLIIKNFQCTRLLQIQAHKLFRPYTYIGLHIDFLVYQWGYILHSCYCSLCNKCYATRSQI